MTLPDVLRRALELANAAPIVLMRHGADYQILLTADSKRSGLMQMRYVCGTIIECPWFPFEGFSLDAALADDWKVM